MSWWQWMFNALAVFGAVAQCVLLPTTIIQERRRAASRSSVPVSDETRQQQ